MQDLSRDAYNTTVDALHCSEFNTSAQFEVHKCLCFGIGICVCTQISLMTDSDVFISMYPEEGLHWETFYTTFTLSLHYLWTFTTFSPHIK
jgi:hypothetical protein